MNTINDIKLDIEFNNTLHNTEKSLFTAVYAYENGKITLLFGAAGAGKTTALTKYAESNPNVTYLAVNPTCKSSRAILMLLLETINQDSSGTQFQLMERLVTYYKDLRSKNIKQLIIIDEADHLSAKALQSLRHLNDTTKVGMVFSGNDKIYYQMYGRGSLPFDQLRTRIGSRAKVTNSYTFQEIKDIFVNVDDDCIAYLLKIANRESLRTAINSYEVGYQYCIEKKAKMELKVLKNVQKQLFDEVL